MDDRINCKTLRHDVHRGDAIEYSSMDRNYKLPIFRSTRSISESQRRDYLDTLPDDVLEDYITAQTRIPRGRLTDGMLEAIATNKEIF